jgi:ABC-type transport system involved in cytochrome c biogenesis permease subunit
MASISPLPLVACVCFLLAALAFARRWRIGAWLAAAGAVTLAGALTGRGLRAGYWPLTGEYEFALAFALGTSLAALIFVTPNRRVPAVQAATVLIAALLVAYAGLALPDFKRTISPLLPALDSIWLPLHVGTAALGYSTLSVTGAAGLIWLLREPERMKAERVLDRAIAAGFPLLTLSMILGMIWAQVAWGCYWSWDLKEVWTLIIWLICALYWHVRRRPHWQGRRLAWLALASLGSVLFTLLGIGWLARAVGLESFQLF